MRELTINELDYCSGGVNDDTWLAIDIGASIGYLGIAVGCVVGVVTFPIAAGAAGIAMIGFLALGYLTSSGFELSDEDINIAQDLTVAAFLGAFYNQLAAWWYWQWQQGS
jgi:hypothetical protein